MYDVTYNGNAELSFTLVKDNDRSPYFSADEIRALNRWLISPTEYKWLRFGDHDSEFEDINYHVIITDVKGSVNAGDVYALTYTAECDSPFGWSSEKRITLKSTSERPTTYVIYSDSDDRRFVYPYLSITCEHKTGVKIVNEDDDNREFMVETLTPDSDMNTAYFDGENQIVKTNGIMSLDTFNFKFLRLVYGKNELTLTGDFTAELTYRCARMAGV